MRTYISLEAFGAEVGLPVNDGVIVDEATGARMTSRGIAAASLAVDSYLKSALYRVDPEGFPYDGFLRDIFVEATMAQAIAIWDNEKSRLAGVALSPLGKPLQSASINGASYTVDRTAAGAQIGYQMPADGGLCLAASQILDSANLTTSVIVYG